MCEPRNVMIHQPSSTFDFSQLRLEDPIASPTGSGYFSKIICDTSSLYIETSELYTKQGIVKLNNKTICDLLLRTNQDEELITWFENLETICHKLMFDNADNWFSNQLEYEDIAAAFISPLKSYKAGKNQLCRCNINTKGIHPTVLYDENETMIPLHSNEITDKTQVVFIIEINGISFTTKTFHIDLIIKQAMLVAPEHTEFNECLIKRHKQQIHKNTNKNSIHLNIKNEEPEIKEEEQKEPEIKETDWTELVEITKLSTENNKLNNTDNNIVLQPPSQIYREMYKKAKIKAQELKSKAIEAILEANNIKNTHLATENDGEISDSDISDIGIELK